MAIVAGGMVVPCTGRNTRLPERTLTNHSVCRQSKSFALHILSFTFNSVNTKPKSHKQCQKEYADRQKAKDLKNREKQARSAKKKRDFLAADPFAQKMEVAKLLCHNQDKEAQRIVKLQAAKEKCDLKNEQERLDKNVTNPGNKVRNKVANMFNRTAGWFSGAPSLAEETGLWLDSLSHPLMATMKTYPSLFLAHRSSRPMMTFIRLPSPPARDSRLQPPLPPMMTCMMLLLTHCSSPLPNLTKMTTIGPSSPKRPLQRQRTLLLADRYIFEAHEDDDEDGDYLSFKFEASVATTKNTAPRESLEPASSEFSVTPCVSESSVTSSVAEDDEDMSVAAPRGSLKSIVEDECHRTPFQSEQSTATTKVVTLPLTEQEWEFRCNEEEGLVVATFGQKLIWQAVETLVPGIEPKDGLGNVLV
eukprot:scaffold34612_cov165-Amphora_coffeaeformis.AAC.3